jgi:hypothetical protein
MLGHCRGCEQIKGVQTYMIDRQPVKLCSGCAAAERGRGTVMTLAPSGALIRAASEQALSRWFQQNDNGRRV